MKNFCKVVCVLALGIAIGRPTPSRADDKEIIEYREHIMTTLNEQTAALGEIVSGAIPADSAAEHFQAIALAASLALKAFEPKAQGGEAKPVVWTDWADFSKRMTEFAAKSAASAKMAREQGKDAPLTDLVGAFSCKECHDVYREKKKSK